MEYDFNARTSLLGFVQYNNEDQRVERCLRAEGQAPHRTLVVGTP
jgi:hypothetical protein